VEKVVTLDGSGDGVGLPLSPAVALSTATATSSSVAAPAVVSEVVQPSPLVTSDASFSPAAENQLPPSLHSPDQLSPAVQPPPDVGEIAAQPADVAEDAGGGLVDDKTCSASPPSNDVTCCPPTLTKVGSSSQLQDVADGASLPVPPVTSTESS